jgi:hypothetical protein
MQAGARALPHRATHYTTQASDRRNLQTRVCTGKPNQNHLNFNAHENEAHTTQLRGRYLSGESDISNPTRAIQQQQQQQRYYLGSDVGAADLLLLGVRAQQSDVALLAPGGGPGVAHQPVFAIGILMVVAKRMIKESVSEWWDVPCDHGKMLKTQATAHQTTLLLFMRRNVRVIRS